jgi:aspartate/glutamate racemase
MKEAIDDLITDTLAMSFHAKPGEDTIVEPVEPEDSRQSQIARQILQLAQELLSMDGSDQVLDQLDFEEV